ncbi:MAG: type IV pilin [Thermoplasmata archaeon]|nr:type IV pilin [Thermoplasmata archaeon]
MKRAWIIRRNEKAVSPVIATILMVAITVVLAAVLYVMVSGLIGGTTASEPNVQFQSPQARGTNSYEIAVAGISEAKDFTSFQVILIKDGAEVDVMDPLSGNPTDNITYTDLDGGGKLTVGDYFIVDTTPDGDFKLSIIWKDSGNERGKAVWTT